MRVGAEFDQFSQASAFLRALKGRGIVAEDDQSVPRFVNGPGGGYISLVLTGLENGQFRQLLQLLENGICREGLMTLLVSDDRLRDETMRTILEAAGANKRSFPNCDWGYIAGPILATYSQRVLKVRYHSRMVCKTKKDVVDLSALLGQLTQHLDE